MAQVVDPIRVVHLEIVETPQTDSEKFQLATVLGGNCLFNHFTGYEKYEKILGVQAEKGSPMFPERNQKMIRSVSLSTYQLLSDMRGVFAAAHLCAALRRICFAHVPVRNGAAVLDVLVKYNQILEVLQ